MPRPLRLVPFFALLSALGGCIQTIGPTFVEEPGMEPGPFPHGYKQIVMAWIQDEFRFYSQVQSVRVVRPAPGRARTPISLRRTRYGWWTRLDFRALDRLGASTGVISYNLLIREGRVVSHQKLIY
jgi:hypothetical protein